MLNCWFLRRANSINRYMMFAVASAICGLGLIHEVRAADTCTGTYSASLIHPIKSPNVVLLPDKGRPELTELRGRLVAGLSRGGVVTSGQPSTRLDFSAMAIPAPGMVSVVPGSYHGFGWALDSSMSGDPVVASTLQVLVTLTNVQTYEISWVFTLQCTILTEDRGRVVERIGEIIGRSMGKEVPGGRL